jgi:putative FmdB family regulatory protein
MPLYEYECKKCHHRFEKIQKFSDRHVKKCPECGGPIEQLISAATVQFKGSGWYVTDYAKKSTAGSSSASDGDSSSKSDSASKSDSDSKGDSASKSDSVPKKESKPKTESKAESKKTEKK